MSHLRTMVVTAITFEVNRESVTAAEETEFSGTGFLRRFERRERPVYRFDLNILPLVKSQMESLSAFHAFHRGGKSFLWNGCNYGYLENFIMIAEGDGARRQFFTPDRYIGANSFELKTENQATGTQSTWTASSNGWPFSLNPNPGIVTFANSANTIPLSGHDILTKYGNQYRVFFEPRGFIMREIAGNVYACQAKLQEAEIFD